MIHIIRDTYILPFFSQIDYNGKIDWPQITTETQHETMCMVYVLYHIDDLFQDCSNSSALVLELLHFYTKQ